MPSWARSLLPQALRNSGKPAGRADASMVQLKHQNAELRSQIKSLKGQADPVDHKLEVNLGDFQAMLDRAKKIGDDDMVRLAQKRLDEAKKTDQRVGNPLKVIFDKLDKARKRTEQATA